MMAKAYRPSLWCRSQGVHEVGPVPHARPGSRGAIEAGPTMSQSSSNYVSTVRGGTPPPQRKPALLTIKEAAHGREEPAAQPLGAVDPPGAARHPALART